MLFFIHCFSTSSITLPWTITKFLHPFCTFSPGHRRVVRGTSILTFWTLLCYSFTASATVLSELFLSTGVFYLRLLLDIFGTICFYHGLSESQHFFVEVCRASCWSSKHRPSPSVCLSHNNPQIEYGGRFYLWFTADWLREESAPHEIRTLFATSTVKYPFGHRAIQSVIKALVFAVICVLKVFGRNIVTTNISIHDSAVILVKKLSMSQFF